MSSSSPYVPTPYQRHGATTRWSGSTSSTAWPNNCPTSSCWRVRTDDILRAKAEGKVAGIAGLEGAEALDASLGVLRQFHRLGLRNLGLAWNHRNAACDGVAESRTNGGVTEFGVKVVEECNRLGHPARREPPVARRADRIAPAVSQQPIIASHSNALRVLCLPPANLTDAQMEAYRRQRRGDWRHLCRLLPEPRRPQLPVPLTTLWRTSSTCWASSGRSTWRWAAISTVGAWRRRSRTWPRIR